MYVDAHRPILVTGFGLDMEVKGWQVRWDFFAWAPRYVEVCAVDADIGSTWRIHYNCIHRRTNKADY